MVTPDRVRMLIADTESGRYLAAHFSKKNFDVSTAVNGEDALRSVRTINPAIVLLDSELPGLPISELLERIKQTKPDVSVVVLAHALDPVTVFRLSKLGADDLLLKPVQIAELEEHVAKHANHMAIAGSGPLHGHTPVQKLNRNTDLSLLYGASPAMEEIRNTIEQVAETTATVLIRGESGTGKEVTARMVYAQSLRRDKPFVKINCAAIPY